MTAKSDRKARTREELLELLYDVIAASVELRASGMKYAGAKHAKSKGLVVNLEKYETDWFSVDSRRALFRVRCTASGIDISDYADKGNAWRVALNELINARAKATPSDGLPELETENQKLRDLQEAAAALARSIDNKYS